MRGIICIGCTNLSHETCKTLFVGGVFFYLEGQNVKHEQFLQYKIKLALCEKLGIKDQ